MRGQSAILNVFTCLTLAAAGLVALGVLAFMAVPGLVPGFLRSPSDPVQVSLVTPLVPVPTPTHGLQFPTLPPEWTATPSPAPSATTTTAAEPSATLTPEVTDTPFVITPPDTRTPAASATSARVIQVAKFANVRSGPGTAYPVVSQLKAALTAPALGRDPSGLWYAISFDGAPGGTGWVSNIVGSYSGSPNDLPVIQPSGPPPATNTPAATSTPSASATPTSPGANGIQTLKFSMRSTTGNIGTQMWFDFSVKNVSGSTITYGILAAHTDQGVTADSWHDPLPAGKTLNWTDYIKFSSTGTYQVYLGICYDKHDPCKSGGAGWTRLSDYVTVTIF